MLCWIHGVSLKDSLRSQLVYGIEHKRRKKPEDITRTMLDINYLEGAPSSDGWTISGDTFMREYDADRRQEGVVNDGGNSRHM